MLYPGLYLYFPWLVIPRGELWRRQWHPTPVLLPGKSHGRRSLVGCNSWGCEDLDMTEWLHFHFSLSCIREGNGNPLQCSCLENPRDRGAWWAAIYGVAQSRTQLKWLSSRGELSKCFCILAWSLSAILPTAWWFGSFSIWYVFLWGNSVDYLWVTRDGWAWWAAVCGVTQSQTRLKRFSSSSSNLYGSISPSVCNPFLFSLPFLWLDSLWSLFSNRILLATLLPSDWDLLSIASAGWSFLPILVLF